MKNDFFLSAENHTYRGYIRFRRKKRILFNFSKEDAIYYIFSFRGTVTRTFASSDTNVHNNSRSPLCRRGEKMFVHTCWGPDDMKGEIGRR